MRDLDAVCLIRRLVSRPAIALLAVAPAVPGVPLDFVLFALTLLGGALVPKQGDPPAAPASVTVR